MGLGKLAFRVAIGLWSALLAGCGTGLLQENEHKLPAGTPTGALVGQVRDAVSGEPLPGVRVSLRRNGLEVAAGASNDLGLYQFRIEADAEYAMRYQLEGYQTSNYLALRTRVDELRPLETVRMVSLGIAGQGPLQGGIRSAQDGSFVPEAALLLRPGINNTQSEPLLIEASDGAGNYALPALESGSYTVELQAEGFAPAYQTLVVAGQTRAQDLMMSPDDLGEGQARIVLSWQDPSWDGDAFLHGPTASGDGRFMVYYSQYNADGANLRLQSQDVAGVESVEILQQYPGSYYFAVDDFVPKGGLFSGQSEAMAKVTLYRSGERREVFYPPLTRRGACWTVFELNGEQLRSLNDFREDSCKNSLQALP